MTELGQMAQNLGQQIRRRLRDHSPAMVVNVRDRMISISNKDTAVIVMNMLFEDDHIVIDGAPWECMVNHEMQYSDPGFDLDKIMSMILSSSL